MFETPREVSEKIAKQAQAKRLSLDFSQKSLSDRSGVSLGVLKKFERSGSISLESLLKIALALGSLEDFLSVFKTSPSDSSTTLDEILLDTKRKRGRK